MASRNEVRWLTSDQQKAWRAYIMGTELLQHQLDRELREEHDISFSEYEILVRLSEAEDGRMRMAILADAMSHSRSRVTHTIARMERADLVVREASRADGRDNDPERRPSQAPEDFHVRDSGMQGMNGR